MSDNDLIARLRDPAVFGTQTAVEAADRIEALVRERDEALEWLSASQGYIADAVLVIDRADRAEAAEAALKDAYFAGWADGSDTTSVTGDPTPDWEAYKHGSQK